MKTAGFCLTAALACFAPPLMAADADRASTPALPRFQYQRAASAVREEKPPPGTPYATAEAAKAASQPAVKLPTVAVHEPADRTAERLKDFLSQEQRMAPCDLGERILPSGSRLEVADAPEPVHSGAAGSAFADTANVPLMRLAY